MANNNLTYTIISPTYGSRAVSPLGEPNFKRKTEIVNDEDRGALFDHIYTFDGTLKFVGRDYDFIMLIESDLVARGEDLIIQIVDTATGLEILEGTKLILNNGTYNHSKCEVTIPVTCPDLYELFNEKKGDELNMFEAAATLQTVKMFDYTPNFEFNTCEKVVGTTGLDGMTLSTQNFEYYPNSRAQYPGFGCPGETADPYWFETSLKIFDTADLLTLTREPSATYEEYLTTGSLPYFAPDAALLLEYPAISYTTAFDALADGWKLYYFKYDINSNEDGSVMLYIAKWQWVREVINVTIGTIMGAEWIYLGVFSGIDRYAKHVTLMPRTNIYRPAHKFAAFPNESRILFEYTTFLPGIATSLVDPYDNSQNKFGYADLVNGLRLNDIIEYAVGYCCPALTVKSDFFQINPFTVSTTDYVTGEESFVNEILMFQKSDVKRPWAPEHATKGIFTTESLFSWLKTMFNIRYRIDGDNFVIEYVTAPYFVHALGIDLTVEPYLKWTNNRNIHSYDKSVKLPAKETFTFMEVRKQVAFSPEDDFAGMPITYDGNNVDRTSSGIVKEHKVDRITTDVYFIMEHSGGLGYVIDTATSNPYPVQQSTDDNVISDDGFCLIASKIISGSRYGITKDAILDTQNRFNNVLGWAYLHTKYYREFRNAPTGTINGIAVTFASTKYIKKSEPYTFRFCDISEFDPFALVNSDIGEGVVRSSTFNFSKKMLTIELAFR